MKNVLLINGSPKGMKSNTLQLSNAFTEGLKTEGDYQIEILDLYQMEIKHCTGCFGCWTVTPGHCVLKDDMASTLTSVINSDLLIWSFPLYYFGMPSKTKAFLDRWLPLNRPEIQMDVDGNGIHPSRYDLSQQKHILISTCGFYSRSRNYEALLQQFDILFGSGIRIICPEGELFSQKALRTRTGEYLDSVRQAGKEYAGTGQLNDSTTTALEELLYPPETFMEMANASWQIADNEKSENAIDTDRFIRQMAALYNPDVYKKDLVIQIYFTDRDRRYSLFIEKNRCTVNPDECPPPDTTIETDFSTWREIADGIMNGAQAMMDGLYKVKGRFETMNELDSLFSGRTSERLNKNDAGVKKTSLNLLLFPWIALWIFLPIDSLYRLGTAGAIILSILTLLSEVRFKLTLWDRLSSLLVVILGTAVLTGLPPRPAGVMSYFLFGTLWLVSSMQAIPLTAHYSQANYGGSKALTNPLFMKTNRIITVVWGVSYILLVPIAVWLYSGRYGSYTGLITQIVPAAAGLFTLLFQRWYPQKVARGH